MKCPACSHTLSHIVVNEVELDICKGGCGGIWFDNFEFKKFDEPHEYAGDELLNVERGTGISVDHSTKRHCPKCSTITMMRHFFSIKKQVEIDECAGCAGIWLDTGELSEIRSLFDSEEARHQAAEKVFSDLFGPQLEALAKEREANAERAERIANMFKYLCPSYYLPGKQKWGAF